MAPRDGEVDHSTLVIRVRRVGAGAIDDKVTAPKTSSVGPALPRYQSEHAAGLDLAAALAEPVTLAPGERRLVPTGLALAIPPGFEGQVRPRSGLALRHGVTVLNAPGTIDADYRGEVKVLLINHGEEPFTIAHGDRIAQLVVARVERVELALVDDLDGTGRGEGGYGSTGRR